MGCVQSLSCHNKTTSDFTFVGCSSLIATAGHSSESKNVCIWDTLLPPRSALVHGEMTQYFPIVITFGGGLVCMFRGCQLRRWAFQSCAVKQQRLLIASQKRKNIAFAFVLRMLLLFVRMGGGYPLSPSFFLLFLMCPYIQAMSVSNSQYLSHGQEVLTLQVFSAAVKLCFQFCMLITSVELLRVCTIFDDHIYVVHPTTLKTLNVGFFSSRLLKRDC